MIVLTRNQIAELRGVTPSAVTQAHLPQTDGKRYDLSNSQVWHYVVERDIKKALDEYKSSLRSDSGETNTTEILRQKDIALKDKRAQLIDIAIAEKKKDLVPIGLLAIWISLFAQGIRNNFLNVGKRVARGNKALQAKIEKEIKRCIEKALDTAETGLRDEPEILRKALEEPPG